MNFFFTAGHLDMVRFLLEAGADQEHKTDEMHTALMEACMVSIWPKSLPWVSGSFQAAS